MDLQAQSRAHRIGQNRPVVVYQLITKCTVEEKILHTSKKKLAIENLVMNPSKKPDSDELQSILLHGSRTILNKKNMNATLICYDDNAIDDLLKLDPAPDERCAADENGYLGSIQSFNPDSTDNPSTNMSKEWENIFGPVSEKIIEEFGRGKRRKKAVKIECEDHSDSDEAYTPEGSTSTCSSDDSDYEYDYNELS